ncbi:PREDICTED: IQ domain-containing protein C, partial [Buceros rhinoceros silvestris]|uniref:IQ domain-containing protein C n=1 Tax=Buceros rhinoceros silvestris TaxID=175836 RepID=UPI0005291679
CVRGYLLRKQFRSLRAEYEEVVREIEGDLSQLRWRGQLLPHPVFVPEVCASGRGGGHGVVWPGGQSGEPPAGPLQSLFLHFPLLPIWDCDAVKPPAPLQSEEEPGSAGDGDTARPPDRGA